MIITTTTTKKKSSTVMCWPFYHYYFFLSDPLQILLRFSVKNSRAVGGDTWVWLLVDWPSIFFDALSLTKRPRGSSTRTSGPGHTDGPSRRFRWENIPLFELSGCTNSKPRQIQLMERDPTRNQAHPPNPFLFFSLLYFFLWPFSPSSFPPFF